MRTKDPGWKRKRGVLAARTRHHGPDDPEVVALGRDLAAQSLEEHVRAVVAGAPPLTETQIDKLATLLQGGAAG